MHGVAHGGEEEGIDLDFKRSDDASPRQDIAQDIENEIAITQCCGRIRRSWPILPHAFLELRPQDSLGVKSRRQIAKERQSVPSHRSPGDDVWVVSAITTHPEP